MIKSISRAVSFASREVVSANIPFMDPRGWVACGLVHCHNPVLLVLTGSFCAPRLISDFFFLEGSCERVVRDNYRVE